MDGPMADGHGQGMRTIRRIRTICKVLFFSSTATKLVDTSTENVLRAVYTCQKTVTHELGTCKPELGTQELANALRTNATSNYARAPPHLANSLASKIVLYIVYLKVAWSEDVQCDTCQLNIVSGLLKRACEKVASTHTVASTDSASRNVFLKIF
jgi:hypothetical protein